MSDQQIPAEYGWIKPNNLGIKNTGEEVRFLGFPYFYSFNPISSAIVTKGRGIWLVTVFDGERVDECWCCNFEPSSNISLTISRKQADQLLLCIDAGLAWDKNFKDMLKMKLKHFSDKDRGFMRSFRVRIVNSIKKMIEEKMK